MAKLNQQEIDELLHQPMIAHLVTLHRDGRPHVAPVWFLWDEGRPLVMADAKALKVRNIRNNPAVAVSIATPERPLSYVVMEGQAKITSDGLESVVERMCVLYDGPVRGKEFAAELLGDERMILLDISVDKTIGWKSDD
ncbi:MAG: TIGR03618 family F420-dependent PPOX class oxidoreductase [SAR202 cluster bacterium]|nr:hypothetical protein [Chloroflexota bacterium]MBR84907.1 hypothetical protein [Euryarchaeota archaeon]MQF96340.1 TIGR03618 family F420-dependent PPOX class oxidoreductase [SAR202 cluster bacterium]HAA95091.1 hypothetical protein [Dehalococcoidia bacterium]MQG32871.1 TIGR03618 family F420-dependent PPOX class oxidoreductase [SAR202 cluster bacterium]|tara:strand:+ start:2244 stop:2660 length:417 start_codon:yes stop_codon:yes gene_type:complete